MLEKLYKTIKNIPKIKWISLISEDPMFLDVKILGDQLLCLDV